MTSCSTLPNRYKGSDYVNLHTDKKLFGLLNAVSFLIGVIMIFLGWLWRSFEPLLELLRLGLGSYGLWLLFLAAGVLIHLAVHQFLHGFLMQRFSGLPSYYGRKGLVLKYAGNQGYFCRRHYLMIAIAPVVFSGIILGALTILFGGAWFWLFFCLQIFNFGSAVGDFYLFGKAFRSPQSALFHDDGFGLAIFTEESE